MTKIQSIIVGSISGYVIASVVNHISISIKNKKEYDNENWYNEDDYEYEDDYEIEKTYKHYVDDSNAKEKLMNDYNNIISRRFYNDNTIVTIDDLSLGEDEKTAVNYLNDVWTENELNAMSEDEDDDENDNDNVIYDQIDEVELESIHASMRLSDEEKHEIMDLGEDDDEDDDQNGDFKVNYVDYSTKKEINDEMEIKKIEDLDVRDISKNPDYEGPSYNSWPYYISEEEYYDDIERSKEVLEYNVAVHKLYDQNGNTMKNSSSLLGGSTLSKFEKSDDQVIYVRNDRLNIDYEIYRTDYIEE